MENQNSQLFLKDADGNRIPVSRNVYDAYWRYANKEDYFMRSLKEERFRYDPEHQIAEFLPSREDSYERLLEEGEEFALEQPSVEYIAEVRILIEKILARLSEEEKQFMRLAFLSDRSETEVSEMMNIPLTTLRYQKAVFLGKCRRILKTKIIFNDTS